MPLLSAKFCRPPPPAPHNWGPSGPRRSAPTDRSLLRILVRSPHPLRRACAAGSGQPRDWKRPRGMPATASRGGSGYAGLREGIAGRGAPAKTPSGVGRHLRPSRAAACWPPWSTRRARSGRGGWLRPGMLSVPTETPASSQVLRERPLARTATGKGGNAQAEEISP